MFQKGLFLVVVFLLTIFAGCSDTNNFKNAIIEKTSSGVCIKLFGKRRLMVHSPNDLVSDNTYIDSLMIYTPKLMEGEIENIEVPVHEGYYKVRGKIIIKGKKLTVKLFIDNTTEKTLTPSDWNGEYNL